MLKIMTAIIKTFPLFPFEYSPAFQMSLCGIPIPFVCTVKLVRLSGCFVLKLLYSTWSPPQMRK